MLEWQSTACEDYPPPATTSMERNMLIVTCKDKSTRSKIIIVNTHLESLKPSSTTRKNQLKYCWNVLKTADADLAIAAGDMNLRDPEVAAVGGVPDGIVDAWEADGARPECQFTWDTTINKNIGAPFASKLRFDRVYYVQRPQLGDAASASSIDPASGSGSVGASLYKQRHFRLIGTRKIQVGPHRLHPSDHWGIVVEFERSSSGS
jgi:endonuclease/exonuclease/phosphatase family metal-dependent hydrolase